MQPINQHLLEKLRLEGRRLVGPDGRVCVDTPCRGCGYDLRSADAAGGCPECGHVVADSLRDDRPEHSDPRWLRRVALGGNLLIVTVVAPAALLVLLLAGGFVLDLIGLHRAVQVLLRYGVLPSVALVTVLAWAAVFLTTAKDPGRHDRPAETRYRWAARCGVVAALPWALAVTLLGGALPGYAGALGNLGFFGAGLLCFAGAGGLLLYLRVLNLRMAEWGVVRSIHTVCFGLSVCAIGALPAVALLIAGTRAEALFAVGASLLCAVAVGMCFFALWAVVLIDQTRRSLNAAHRRVKWAAEDEDLATQRAAA